MCKTKAFIISLVVILLPSFSWAWSGEVVGITDGDTITVLNSKTLKDVKIRLYGIDCPEGGQAFSKRAKQFTSKMVYGKVVEVGAITVDHYGRTVRPLPLLVDTPKSYLYMIARRCVHVRKKTSPNL